MKAPWICHESTMMEPIWIWYWPFWSFRESHMKAPWICHESVWEVWSLKESTIQDQNLFSELWICKTYMKPTCQIHGRFIADSSRIHRGFMPLSVSSQKSKSCQFHGAFMAVSWQFHGTFTYKPYLDTVCQNLLEKVIQKVGFGCRFGFFCLISSSFLAICQIHVGFMVLSWHFHGTFFLLIFIDILKKNPNQQLNPSQKWPSSFNVTFIANSSRIHGAFMSLSCQLHSYVGFIADSSRIHVTFMSVTFLKIEHARN